MLVASAASPAGAAGPRVILVILIQIMCFLAPHGEFENENGSRARVGYFGSPRRAAGARIGGSGKREARSAF